MTEEIINNQNENTQKVLKALEDLRVHIQSQLTEKDKQIEELKATYKKQRNKRIDELQKKNHDLEKENAELKTERGCETCTKFDEVKLTKAKEIIRELLDSCFGYNSKTVNYGIKAEAEAFLNSEVAK